MAEFIRNRRVTAYGKERKDKKAVAIKNILVVVNAALANRGSEALIRGLGQICRKAAPHSTLILSSGEPAFETQADLPEYDRLMRRYNYASPHAPARYASVLLRRLGLHGPAARLGMGRLLDQAALADLILMIGADNFDHTYNMTGLMNTLARAFRNASKARMLLLDCSFAKEDLTAETLSGFNYYDGITVRETVSRQHMREAAPHLTPALFPDPAFIMAPRETSLPEGFVPGGTVGVNLSNLILKSAYADRALVLQAYRRLIDTILDKTDMPVLLLPHVMNGADLSALRLLRAGYEGNSRVLLMEDETRSAPALKYIISRCRLFVGARTHATIAAYSSCVPTLVLGYSVKSMGIATDLFGTTAHYVLPSSGLKTPDQLAEGFDWLLAHEEDVRAHLKERIPAYQEQAWAMADYLAGFDRAD
jgi:polysaccharide pyruvyl transferase WcaK-like protein